MHVPVKWNPGHLQFRLSFGAVVNETNWVKGYNSKKLTNKGYGF